MGGRKFFVGGNWKCNGTNEEIKKIVATLNVAEYEYEAVKQGQGMLICPLLCRIVKHGQGMLQPHQLIAEYEAVIPAAEREKLKDGALEDFLNAAQV